MSKEEEHYSKNSNHQGSSDEENYFQKRASDMDAEDNTRKFLKYENSTRRLLDSDYNDGKDSELELDADDRKRTERLLEIIHRQKNKINLWQAFPSNDSLHAVVFSYDSRCLKVRVNVKKTTLKENFQVKLTSNEIRLTTQLDCADIRQAMQGFSRSRVERAYNLPYSVDFERAACCQIGDYLEICIPWSMGGFNDQSNIPLEW